MGREIVAIVGIIGIVFVVVIVGKLLPVVECIGTLHYFFLKVLVSVLEIAKWLLPLYFVHEEVIWLVFVLLVISCLEVSFLCITFLKVELFFKFNICDIGIHLDHIVPELFLFLECLLDLAYAHIR